MANRRGLRVDPVVLSEHERETLEQYLRRGTTSQRLAFRARIILSCASDLTDIGVAADLGTTRETVGKWRRRFLVDRLQALGDAPRSGTPRTVDDATVEEIIRTTLEEMPSGATRWSTRDMAKRAGVSASTVSRIWRAFGLKPHRSETFQLSTDPDFVAKVHDVVGLYMSPPEHAVVLCTDEKSQIQALNRTQPVLPLRPGQVERRTPEYSRNGTTSLFAALDVATGNVIGKCYRSHKTVQFLSFLRLIDRSVDAHLDVHLILDNYATHKTAKVKQWLQKRPRFHLHFIPTHASWLNQVETWFSILTEKQLKRGSYYSVKELEQSIYDFLEAHNEDPAPFMWTKSANEILDRLGKFCEATRAAHTER